MRKMKKETLALWMTRMKQTTVSSDEADEAGYIMSV